MHKCVICTEKFDSWSMYQMHTDMQKLHDQVGKIVVSKARNTMGVKSPMNDKRFSEAVRRGEARLGAYNFFGGNQ